MKRKILTLILVVIFIVLVASVSAHTIFTERGETVQLSLQPDDVKCIKLFGILSSPTRYFYNGKPESIAFEKELSIFDEKEISAFVRLMNSLELSKTPNQELHAQSGDMVIRFFGDVLYTDFLYEIVIYGDDLLFDHYYYGMSEVDYGEVYTALKDLAE